MLDNFPCFPAFGKSDTSKANPVFAESSVQAHIHKAVVQCLLEKCIDHAPVVNVLHYCLLFGKAVPHMLCIK